MLATHEVSLYQQGDRPLDAAAITIGPSHVVRNDNERNSIFRCLFLLNDLLGENACVAALQVLPARQSAVNSSGACSQSCTRALLSTDINIGAVDINVNSLGQSSRSAEVTRNQRTLSFPATLT